MKKTLFLILFITICLSAFAQVTQYGIVRELNSNGKPVSGVGISVLSTTDFQPVASNSNGTFRLVFSDKKAGERIYNIHITKDNYEIVNYKDFNKGWTLTPYDTLEIIIATKGMVDNLRRHYYELIDQYQVREYQQTIDTLKQRLAAQQITAEEYRLKSEAAEQELRNAYDKLDEYADLFARINKDNLDTISRQALDFLEQGNINKAIAVYENHKLLDKFKKKVILRDQAVESIQSLIPKLQEEVSYRMLVAGSENLQKIGNILENIAVSDTGNFRYAYDYALFLTDQEDLPKAAAWSRRAVLHADNFDNKIDALQNLGHIYYKQNNAEESEKYLLEAVQESEKVKNTQPEAYRRTISYPLNTLANLYMDEGLYEKAEKMLLQCVAIRKDLAQADPKYLADYATALNNLGETYRMMNTLHPDSISYFNALHNFDAAIQIRTELGRDGNLEIRYQLANVFNNKGVLYMDANQLDSATVCYQKANTILEAIVNKNRALYCRYLVVNINNIGLLYSKMKQFDKAVQYFDRGIDLCRQHTTQNPELYQYYESTLLINKGLSFRRQNQFMEAKPYYLQALEIRKELSSQRQDCSYDLFEVYNNLGVLCFNMKQYDSTIFYHGKALSNLECLMPEAPNQYVQYAAICSYSIAYSYFLKEDVENGIDAYRTAKKFCQKANKVSPGRYDKRLADIQTESKALKSKKRHS